MAGLDKVQVRQFSRRDDTREDTLSKLASSVVIEQRGKFLLDYRDTPSYNIPQVLSLDQEETRMTPIIRTLQGKEIHIDRKELAKLRYKAMRYTLVEGVVYRKGVITFAVAMPNTF
ncbi:reverse transcriptase [Gossypium australe]|uniref:Reverse transcriptase n=1 Tax=Gossypium australe TaxID=47621 RepID=A0A5B6VWT4_9ROSI|nr:reverse transcriptase [Gossypium australe]